MRWLWQTGFVLLFVVGSATLRAQVQPAPNDAPLRGIQFIDANEGWAVGDGGVIWHSIDGGKTWDRQNSGTRSNLTAVRFLTPYVGWVVGRTDLPNRDGSVGTVLATADGGHTWTELARGVLPGLMGVRFFDESKGLAWGDGTNAAPGGLYRTQDGGKTWAAVSTSRTTSWLCGEAALPTSGVFCSLGSGPAVLNDAKLAACETPERHGRNIRGLAIRGQSGFCVGDGGLLWQTRDGGAKWEAQALPVSASAAAVCDLTSVAMQGSTVLAVGRPGSVVFRSGDAGKNWETIKTKWPTPLHAVQLVNEKHGWAVGDFGVILHTADGGKSWTVQRQGGSKSAVLAVHALADRLPADLIASMAGSEGYHVVANVVCHAPASTDKTQALDGLRAQAALRLVGGMATELGWGFPVADYFEGAKVEDLLQEWNRLHGGQAQAALVQRLVLSCRMWQPEVLLGDRIAGGVGPAEQLVVLALQEAFKKCSDSQVYPEQLEELGLNLASPKKLYAQGPESAAECPVKFDLNDFDLNLLDSPRGSSDRAFSILGVATPATGRRAYRLISHRLPGSEKHAGLMEGISLAHGGPSRRPELTDLSARKLLEADCRQGTQLRLQLEREFALAKTPAALERALAGLVAALGQLPEDMGCRTALGVARQLVAEGHWSAARELFLVIVSKYDGTAGSLEALRWLTRYYASGEARHRAEREGLVFMPKAHAPKRTVEVVRPANFVEPAIEGADLPNAWPRACLELEAKIGAYGPLYAREPGTVHCALAARRQLGLVGDASKVIDGYFRSMPAAAGLTPGQDSWRDTMATEAWLANPNLFKQPKPLALCPKTSLRPFLDGKLDDECWAAFQAMDLTRNSGPMTGFSTKVYLAHDEDFLYVAVACSHPEGRQMPKVEKRRRDGDVSGRDRIDFSLDLDRDSQSYYRFQIDQTGCVAEDCWGDKSWNPRWFVCVEASPTGWSAELAIPRSELSSQAPAAGTIWGMNVCRLIPGRGVQSWSGPASAAPRPEGFGLMRFLSK